MKLLGAEAGNSDHTYVTVIPRLRGDPFDEIVTVPLPRTAAIRLETPLGEPTTWT